MDSTINILLLGDSILNNDKSVKSDKSVSNCLTKDLNALFITNPDDKIQKISEQLYDYIRLSNDFVNK